MLLGVSAGVLLATAVQVALGAPVLDAFLRSYAGLGVGAAGLFFASGHLLRGAEVAGRIGWEANSPFQAEVGVANLALGVAGLGALLLGPGGLWVAGLAQTAFYLGCAVVHLQDQQRRGNRAELNGGVHVALSVVTPLVNLCALTARAMT